MEPSQKCGGFLVVRYLFHMKIIVTESQLRRYLVKESTEESVDLEMNQSIDTTINELHPNVIPKFQKLVNSWKAKGYKFKITDGFRTFDEQENEFQKGTSKARGGLGIHNYGHAIDVYMWNGKNWDRPSDAMLKVAVNNGFESYGLSWGWDFYHVQYTKEFTGQKGGDANFIKKYGKQLIDSYSKISSEDKKKMKKNIDAKFKQGNGGYKDLINKWLDLYNPFKD